MNAFQDASSVEERGRAILLPFLKRQSHDGRVVLLNKGPMARALQQTAGDAIFNSDADTAWTVEIKTEVRHTGNMFLETWSNRNLEHRESYSKRDSKVGWLATMCSDLLFYYFLDVDHLYIFNLFKLKRWAFGHGTAPGQIYRAQFKETRQGKYAQKNDTWGRLVPLDVLRAEVGYRLVHPKQIPLFDEMDAIGDEVGKFGVVA